MNQASFTKSSIRKLYSSRLWFIGYYDLRKDYLHEAMVDSHPAKIKAVRTPNIDHAALLITTLSVFVLIRSYGELWIEWRPRNFC